MAQAANLTATARRVFPDSGPTRSFHCSQSFTVALASARVVKRPSAAAPMPAAMIAAEIGPSGLSATGGRSSRSSMGPVRSVRAMVSLLLDRCDFGDEGPEGACDAGDDEGEDEQA